METENQQTEKLENATQNSNEMKNENKRLFLKCINIQKIICMLVAIVGMCFIVYGYNKYNKENNTPSDILVTDGYSTESGYDYNSSTMKKPASSSDVVPYVGGDAYNFMIAASLKAGKIASSSITIATEKSIATNYILVGTILLCFSLIVLFNKKK